MSQRGCLDPLIPLGCFSLFIGPIVAIIMGIRSQYSWPFWVITVGVAVYVINNRFWTWLRKDGDDEAALNLAKFGTFVSFAVLVATIFGIIKLIW